MFTTKEEIQAWLSYLYISDYVIHDNLVVDVNENVDLSTLTIGQESHFELPLLPVQFGVVNGFFNCSKLNLISLKGSPLKLNGSFDCSHNRLTSLEYSPPSVKNFKCNDNQLTSLKGAPQHVEEKFHCVHNQLTSLEGSPQHLEFFDCSYNNLISLEGGPSVVTAQYSCSENQLTSFKGIAPAVSSLVAKFNKITSLEGLPPTIYHLDCSYNEITSLEYIPIVKQDFIANANPIKEYFYKKWNIGKKINIDYDIKDKIMELKNHYVSYNNDSGKEYIHIDFSVLAPYLNKLILKEDLEKDLSTNTISNEKRKI